MSRPARQMMDPDMVEKAAHMLRRHSAEKVQQYLGYPLSNILAVQRNMPTGRPQGRPLKRERVE